MSSVRRDFLSAQIDEVAADWLVRRDAGFTPAESSEFEAWRSADPRHRAALQRALRTWSMLERPRRAGREHEMVAALTIRATRRRRRRQMIAAVAAVMVIALSVVGLRWPAARPIPITDATAPMVVVPEKRVLPDGGVIKLKPGAEIAVDYSGEFRRVTLHKGEALFQVAENKARPFIVTAGGVQVRAVGTAFLVTLGAEQVDVLVTDGLVAVESATGNAPGMGAERGSSTPVGAGNRAIVELSTVMKLTVHAVSDDDLASQLGWLQPRVKFSETPLAQAVELINRQTNLTLVIEDPELARMPVNGVFRVDNTETLVRLLEAAFGVTAERSGDTIRLRKAH